ncbi:MAG: capsid cement protein [Allorhizobium sp.]
MKNYKAPGHVITVVTPAGGYVSGKGYVIGSLFGVANLTSAEGERNELSVDGVYEFTGEGLFGDVAYFDTATSEITDTAAPGLFKVGVIVGSAVDTVEVRLNGVDVFAEA